MANWPIGWSSNRFLTPLMCFFQFYFLRNAALVLTPKDEKKCKALGVDPKQLFLSRTALLAKKTKALSELDINLQFFKDTLEAQFKTLEAIAKKTDASFIGSVAAQGPSSLRESIVWSSGYYELKSESLKRSYSV